MTDTTPSEVDEKTTLSPSDEKETPPVDTGDQGIDFTEDLPGEAPRKKTAEARIGELIALNKELKDDLAEMKERLPEPKVVPTVPTPTPATVKPRLTPEVEQAISFLKDQGFATKQQLEELKRDLTDREVLNQEHTRLEHQLDGSDGKPKYDRAKVEAYMREKATYNPEVAYNDLYKNELLDIAIKEAEERFKKRPYTERSGSSTGGSESSAITRDKVQQSLNSPVGRAWYERNRLKILDLYHKGQL